MSEHALEGLLNLLEVRVDAFAICEIGQTAALRCDPFENVVVHFVLHGHGMIECEQGKFPLKPGTVIIMPRKLAKIISGQGPIATIVDANQHCPLEDGLMKFEAGSGEPGLVLGCAALEVSLDGGIDVFEHLGEPMIEVAAGPVLDPVLALIQREVSSPKLGSRAIIAALMKQVLIGVARSQLSRESFRLWLWPAMMNRQLGMAAMAIIAHPEQAHTVASLAATAGMSRSRFSEAFSEAFGRGPIEFLQVVRLRAARRLLMSSSLPVKSVAAAVGYASRSHFSRAYQGYYGQSPSSLRTEVTLPESRELS